MTFKSAGYHTTAKLPTMISNFADNLGHIVTNVQNNFQRKNDLPYQGTFIWQKNLEES